MTSIFEGQPPKTRPFSIKTKVIWVPGTFMYCRVCRVIYTRLHDGSQFLVSLAIKHSNLFRFLEFLKWSVHPSWITAVWTLLSNPNFLADFLWTCIRSFVIHPWLKFGAAAKNDNDPQMFLPMNQVQNKIAVILFPLPPRSQRNTGFQLRERMALPFFLVTNNL